MRSRLTLSLSRLGLAVLGCALALALAEGVLRLFLPPRVAQVGTTRTDKAGLYGWAAAPRLGMSFVDPDSGQSTPFTTNSRGWKDVEHELAKPAGQLRVLFVGDSYTWGFAPLPDIYPRVTERLLHERGHDAVEVISLGVGGWGTDQELEALRHEGVRYEPDLVVYQFSPNDVIDNLLPDPTLPPRSANDDNYAAKPFRYRVDEAGELLREEASVAERGRSLSSWLAQNSALAHHLLRLLGEDGLDGVAPEKAQESGASERAAAGSAPGTPGTPGESLVSGEAESERGGPSRDERWRLMRALVREMRSVAEAVGARFAVYTHVPKPRLQALCEEAGIPLIEPRQPYERYQSDPHTTVAGNRAMAEDLVASFLEWDWFRERSRRQ